MSGMSRPDPAPTLLTELKGVVHDAVNEGRPLPSEHTLASGFGASRPAVREALVRLEERGLIHRSQGTDTVVNPTLRTIKARIDEQIDKSDVIRAVGATPSLKVHRQELVDVTPEEQQRFGLPAGTRALRTVKVWSADGEACTLATDTVPVVPGRADPEEVHAEASVWDIAEDLNGIRAAWETVWMSADVLDPVEAWLLDRPADEPVLRLLLHGVGTRGDTAYWASEVQVKGPIDYALVRHVRRD
jgi:GntR family transcriptional regulator